MLVRIAIAIAALLFSVRGARLGAPVADDWAFLHHLRFTTFSWLDSLGGAYYWRPVSRQIAMSVESLWMERAPWVGALVHLVLLVALVGVLYRMLRRVLPATAAAAVASAPLLTEATRALLTWPSGVQHLLAMLAAALALHETQARRLPTALLAAAVALGSHESSVLVLAALLWVARDTSRSPRQRLAWALAPLALLALWASGYAVARAHGVLMPPQTSTPTDAIAKLPQLAGHLFESLFGLEDLAPSMARAFAGMHLIVWLITLVALFRLPRTRQRQAFAFTALAGLVAALPLALLLPDWNAWRASLPLLMIAIGLGGLIASVDTRLAEAFVALRLVALLLAPTAPSSTQEVPLTRSDLSFIRLARLQELVASTRHELLAAHPSLPAGAHIAYWTMPGLAEVGFQAEKAAQVWYHDPALRFTGFGGLAGFTELPDALIGLDGTEPDHPAVVITPRALQLFARGYTAARNNNAVAVDSLLALALLAQPREVRAFNGQMLFTRANARAALGDDHVADSLLTLVIQRLPDHPGAYSLAAVLAARRGATDEARRLATRALELDPNDAQASQMLRELGTSQRLR